jgi:hypothetical protein
MLAGDDLMMRRVAISVMMVMVRYDEDKRLPVPGLGTKRVRVARTGDAWGTAMHHDRHVRSRAKQQPPTRLVS